MNYTSLSKPADEKSSDSLFALPSGSAVFEGPMIEALDFVENKSLLDPKLWALFIEQFRLGDVDVTDYGWRGEYWGKMVRGACITYGCNRDAKLYRQLEATVRDILTAEDPFGRISTYTIPAEFHGWDVWCRKYVMLGLEYFLEICADNNLAYMVLASLKRQADYLIAKTGCREVGKIDVTYTSEWWEGLNASSILEPVVRLYKLTSDEKYLEYARKIVACGGMRSFDMFKAALEGKTAPYEMPVTKAYEMMSNFEGIIELYRVTGNEDYKTMALNFAELVQQTDITVIGSAGTTHELFDHSAVRQFDPSFTGIMQETCVTVTWMKFCLQLLRLTGDAKYADRIEISAYNALLGAVNFKENPFEGEVFAFDSYSPLLNSVRGLGVGGYKTLGGSSKHWGCCVAIGSAGTGLFPAYAVMKNSRGITFNFYIGGRVKTDFADLEIKTSYPYGDTADITVDPKTGGTFGIFLRIPSWSRLTEVSVNGSKTVCEVENGYASILRNWQKWDKITVKFDMGTRVVRAADIDPDAAANAKNHFALIKGPLVLARDEAMGHDLETPVNIVEKEGYAEEALPASTPKKEPANAPFPRLTVSVLTESGPMEMCDYASCGQDWRNGKKMTAWIISGE